MSELPVVTDELLDALAFRYAEPRVCRICGAELTLVDTQGMKYACTSDAASPYKNRHEPAGATWQEALHHWQDSTMYNPPHGDLRVIALIAEIRKLRHIHDDDGSVEGCPGCFPGPGPGT